MIGYNEAFKRKAREFILEALDAKDPEVTIKRLEQEFHRIRSDAHSQGWNDFSDDH